jgi:hypothetical protein
MRGVKGERKVPHRLNTTISEHERISSLSVVIISEK